MSNQIIYLKGYPSRGEIIIAAKNRAVKKLASLFSRLLFVGGLAAIFLLLSPFVFMELQWRFGQTKDKVATIAHKNSKFAQVIQVSDLQLLNPIDPYFSVVIPKIKVNSQIAAEVAIDAKDSYQSALKKGVAHAQGTSLPGQNGTVYLFGHSSNYFWSQTQPVFYLLKELETGDQVNLFYQNQRFLYQVAEKKIVSPGDLSWLKSQAGTERLVLETCWPLGSNWKRMVVVANKV